MKNNIKTLFEIFKELFYLLDIKERKYAVLVWFVIVISSLFELLGVSSIIPFIQAILTPEVLMENQYVAYVAENVGAHTETEIVVLLGVGLILLYIIKNAYMIFAYYIQYDFASKMRKSLSIKMLKSYLQMSYDFFLDVNSAEVLRGCSTDVEGVYKIISDIFTLITECISILLIGLFLLYVDIKMAVGVLVVVGVTMMGMLRWGKPKVKKAGKENVKSQTQLNKIINQTVTGIKEIFVTQRQDEFLTQYETAAEVQRKSGRMVDFLSSCPDRIVEGVCVSGLLGVVCVRLIANDTMASFIPTLAAFAMAAFKMLPSIGKITSRMNDMVYRRLMLANVYSVIHNTDSFSQKIEKNDEKDNVSNIQFHREVTISHVEWKYKNQKSPVLQDVTLNIKKGESIAFIGESGAGKTTLADVILGLLHPQRGNVKMDGIDIFSIPRQWARIVAYVPQSVFLLDDTIKNNILFGLEEMDGADAAVWDSLERAQLVEFVHSLPNGIDTIVGERGAKFSGGQRQRLAIARALFSKPDILILDEATAALDNETEAAFVEAMERLQGQITMIIVAHRLTTIRSCDRIYEIKDGKAVERTKEEVLR